MYSVALVISISVCAGSKVSENARKRLVVAVGLENGCLQGNQRTQRKLRTVCLKSEEQNRSVVTRWDRGICQGQVRARNRVELAGGCAGQAMI